jgi:hypothetical protein
MDLWKRGEEQSTLAGCQKADRDGMDTNFFGWQVQLGLLRLE